MNNIEFAIEITNSIVSRKVPKLFLYEDEVSEKLSKIYGKTFSTILSALNDIDSIPNETPVQP